MGTESVSSEGDRSSRECVRLLRFFIFNSEFGPREGEEEKRIIFYFTEFENEEKTKQVGLAEAVIKFSKVFSDKPCECLSTQKSKTIFYEPEPGFFMALTASVPYVTRKKSGNSNTENVFQPDNVHENMLFTVLKRGYDLFRFFTGGFTHLDPDTDRQLFLHRVSSFFSRYVANIHLEKMDVSDLFQAVHFLTLEASAFLQVESFIHRVEDEFNCIEMCAFFHQGYVAWSGLQQKETALLYHYLYTSLIPSTSSKTASGTHSLMIGPFNGHQGRFLTGPQSLKDVDVSLVVPKVFIPQKDGDGLKEYHLIVFHALGATLVLLLPLEIELTVELFRRLDAHLGPRLTHMSADLHNVFGRQFGPAPGFVTESIPHLTSTSPSGTNHVHVDGDDRYHFLYFNSHNHAMKSTLPQVLKYDLSEDGARSKDALHIISDLEMDLSKIESRSSDEGGVSSLASSTTKDISVKLPSDHWVVGRKDSHRKVFAVVQTKTANLVEVGDEVDRMMAAEFKNICLLEK